MAPSTSIIEVCCELLPPHTTFSASAPHSMASDQPKAHPSVPPDPCHNGGSCTDGINTAFCDCLPGFQGAFCEEDINECASNPCRNGANCTDCVDSYTCTCPAGFNGIHCENNTPDCTERWVTVLAETGKAMDSGGHKALTAGYLKWVSCPDPVGI